MWSVWANTKRSGSAAHGDYLFGWKDDTLQRAMDNGCNLNNDCPSAGISYQPPEVYNACKIPQQAPEEVDGCEFSFRPWGLEDRTILTAHSLYRATSSPSWRVHHEELSEAAFTREHGPTFSLQFSFLMFLRIVPGLLFLHVSIALPRRWRRKEEIGKYEGVDPQG